MHPGIRGLGQRDVGRGDAVQRTQALDAWEGLAESVLGGGDDLFADVAARGRVGGNDGVAQLSRGIVDSEAEEGTRGVDGDRHAPAR